jgi:hypothetical protein
MLVHRDTERPDGMSVCFAVRAELGKQFFLADLHAIDPQCSSPMAGQSLRQGAPKAFRNGLACETPAAQVLRAIRPGPGQTDFGRIDISTVKDALGSMHWNVDAVELAEQRHAIEEPQLRSGRCQRGVLCRRCALDDEAGSGQRFEHRHERRITDPVVRPRGTHGASTRRLVFPMGELTFKGTPRHFAGKPAGDPSKSP